MDANHLTIDFSANVGHRTMAAHVREGYLWCLDTPQNRANAEVLWPTIGVMRLSVAEEMPSTREALASVLEAALEHHRSVCLATIIAFPDETIADLAMDDSGFIRTGAAFTYRRAP